MAHTLGGTTLYVVDEETADTPIRAGLDVLDSTKTVVQHFSVPSPYVKITAYVATQANATSIINMVRGSSSVEYVTNLGSSGDFFLQAAQWRRQKGTPSGFGGVSPSDPVWLVTINMLRDDS